MAVRLARRMERVVPNAIGDLLRHGVDPDLVSFAGGYPAPELFPAAELRAIYAGLLEGDDRSVMQYTVSNGLPGLRRAIASRMAREGVDATPDEILVLQGAQQGLDLVAKMLIDPGDVIVTEDPTFLGALIAFAPYEPRYAPVRLDGDGMETDDLARVLAENPGARLLYTVPDFQNPTGVTLSLERRHRLLELAREHDLVVLEDSPYRDLRFAGTPLPTLASLDTDGRVIYLGSFSKTLVPGMRLGWAVARGELGAKLGLLKLAADTQCSTLNMAAAAAYLERYDLDAHIADVRAAYLRKRDLMLGVFDELLPPSVTFTRPEGGLFTWLAFPDGFDAAAFMREQAIPRAKVAYVPGGTFFPVREQPNHARVNFSGVTDGQIVAGATRLANLLRDALPG